MKLFDKYVARFQSAIDDEYQLDVMYRSLTIDNVIYTWTLLSVGAVLTWAVPPAYVWCSLLTLIPLLVCEYSSAQYVRRRSGDKGASISMGRGVLGLIAFVWIVGLARHPLCDGFRFMVPVIALAGVVAVFLLRPSREA
ncbi:hypothetical protein [Corynebacterium durum]